MTQELRTYFVFTAFAAVLASVVVGSLLLGMLWQFREPVFSYLFHSGHVSMVGVVPELAVGGGGTAEAVVSKAVPAVVSIVIEKEITWRESYFDDGEFDLFLRDTRLPVPKLKERVVKHQQVGGGSGVAITRDGYILTNKHVVSDPGATYTVVLEDGTKLPVKKIVRSDKLDVALIKVKHNLTPAPLGDSSRINVGQTVVAIGNAMAEFQNSVSVGVVSGLDRFVVASGDGGPEYLEGVIQTDAAINPGNSGGPLLNLGGEVIGINVAVAQDSENIGFALPINQVKAALGL